MHKVTKIYSKAMALDSIQNFVSAQYLEKEWMEFYKIVHTLCYWQDIGWDCFTPICANLQQSYGP